MRRHAGRALAALLLVAAAVTAVLLLTWHPTPQAEAVVYPTSQMVPASKVVAFERWSAPSEKGLGATLSFDSTGAIHIIARSANPLDATATANAVADSYAEGLKTNGAGIGSFKVRLADPPDTGAVPRLLTVVLAVVVVVCAAASGLFLAGFLVGKGFLVGRAQLRR